jgi:hypothetical protein
MKTKVLMALLVCVSMSAGADITVVGDFSTQYAGYTLDDSMYMPFTNTVDLYYTFVRSAVYVNADKSNYVYLYQVTNWNFISTLHSFSAADFAGLTTNTAIGYISGAVPADFLANGNVPVSGSAHDKTIEFSCEISSGLYSAVLFVESPYSSGVIDGYLQNGGHSSGQVLGAIPEPATMGLLLFGSLLAARRCRA